MTLLGRGNVSINSGGEKIFPEEVEMALKAHPNILNIIVIFFSLITLVRVLLGLSGRSYFHMFLNLLVSFNLALDLTAARLPLLI